MTNLELKNWAILVKWWWRFGEERDALWNKIVVSKYGEEELGCVMSLILGGLCSKKKG